MTIKLFTDFTKYDMEKHFCPICGKKGQLYSLEILDCLEADDFEDGKLEWEDALKQSINLCKNCLKDLGEEIKNQFNIIEKRELAKKEKEIYQGIMNKKKEQENGINV